MLLQRLIHKRSACLLMLLCIGSVQASTTFESVSNFLETDPAQVFMHDELSFSASSYYGVQSGLFLTNNPGRYFAYFAGGASSMSFARTDAQAFDLNGFSFGPSENVLGADSIVLTGYLASGGSVSQTLSFNTAAASLSFAGNDLPAFRNLSHVVFGPLSQHFGYAWIDNIITAPVPEPEASFMLLAGLGLLAGMRRRAR